MVGGEQEELAVALEERTPLASYSLGDGTRPPSAYLSHQVAPPVTHGPTPGHR
jgi:hypothetical protein